MPWKKLGSRNSETNFKGFELNHLVLAMYQESKGGVDKHAKKIVSLIQRLPYIEDNFQALKAFGYLRKKKLKEYNKYINEQRKVWNKKQLMRPLMAGGIGKVWGINSIELDDTE